jgi:hypothetical protein
MEVALPATKRCDPSQTGAARHEMLPVAVDAPTLKLHTGPAATFIDLKA